MLMIVGTIQAAKTLNISTTRLRVLLKAGRVKGAYKTGKVWLMPLFNGYPIIEKCDRGPKPKWDKQKEPTKTIVHVNSHKIKHNRNHQDRQPVITAKKGSRNIYGHRVEIPGGCQVVYSPDRPRPCGAKVWIESLYDVKVISWD